MTSSTSSVLVLSKSDYTQQTLLPLTTPPVPDSKALPPSTIVVRSTVIALTSNNLSYARGGSIRHWWSTYPVPSSLPQPYNSSSTHGIVPAWGYGTILASSIPDLQPNTVLWGYFPVSTFPVSLLLKPGNAKGHWIESSPHRDKLMPLYQRYVVPSPSSPITSQSPVLDQFAWRALLYPLWECAYLLNRFVFPQIPNTTLHALHPSAETRLPWPSSSSDLTNALVILLAASSKTALSFAQQLKHARQQQDLNSPLGVIGVTSESSLPFVQNSHWFDDVLLYGDVQTSLPGLLATAQEKHLSHVVVLDFGGRNDADQKVHTVLAAAQPRIPTTIIGVGAEPKPLTAAEGAAVQEKEAGIGKIRMNTSNLRVAAIEMLGEQAYFDDAELKWKQFLEAGGIPGMRLKWGEGMEGEEGAGAGWKALCGGEGTKLQPDEGMVFRL